MKRLAAAVFARVLVGGGSAAAQTARLVAVSMARGVTEGTIPTGITDTFPPDAPAIHGVAVFADAVAGTTVRGSWVAVDAIATPNYEIDAAEVSLVAGEARAHFQLSKPNSGWPVGHYKLNLFVDGVLVTAVPFAVAPAASGAPADWAAGRAAPPPPPQYC